MINYLVEVRECKKRRVRGSQEEGKRRQYRGIEHGVASDVSESRAASIATSDIYLFAGQ